MSNKVCIFCASFSLELGVDLENNKTYRECRCIEGMWDLDKQLTQYTNDGWPIGDTNMFYRLIMTARTCDMYDPCDLYEVYAGPEFYTWAMQLGVIEPKD